MTITTINTNDLKKENIIFTAINENQRKELVKKGFVCLMQNSYKNQIIDIAENIQNSDEYGEFLFTENTERRNGQFAIWQK